MDSPEYMTLNQCYPTLVSCVQLSPNDIAVQLRPSGILPSNNFHYLNNPAHDADEKAQQLLGTVLTQVQIDPTVYHTFTAALRAAGPWTKNTVSTLESTYAAKSSSIEASLIDSEASLSTAESFQKRDRVLQADCYPGNSVFSKTVQEIYHSVTSDKIVLDYLGTRSTPINRYNLCSLLVNHHNYGKNPGQAQTNREFHGNLYISHSSCVNALTYTTGYDTSAGWQSWAGYHSGKWYTKTQIFSDSSRWFVPYLKSDLGQTYSVQPVRFDSQRDDLEENCATDSTNAACHDGWNQSGPGIQYVWSWNHRDNTGPLGYEGGRHGAQVGFTFTENSASCIVWVTTEEAFLECVRNGRRTTTSSGPSVGYGQWTVSA